MPSKASAEGFLKGFKGFLPCWSRCFFGVVFRGAGGGCKVFLVVFCLVLVAFESFECFGDLFLKHLQAQDLKLLMSLLCDASRDPH